MANKVVGTVPSNKASRIALLKTHQSHVISQPDVQTANARPVKQPLLHEAYAASTKSLRDLELIPLSELKVEIHHRGRGIIVRTIAPPYRGAGAVTVVEDEHGNVDKLAIYNLSETSLLSNPPEGCILAVKEPYYKLNGENDFMICVDHPSDVLLLRFSDPIIPEILRRGVEEAMAKPPDEWKAAGDAAFIQRDFPTAVYCYSEALEGIAEDDSDARAGVLAKRTGTNLMLGHYDAAMEDALASRTGADSDWKSYFTAAKAAYGLCEYQSCKSFLESALEKSPKAPNVQKEYERCLARLREEKEGVYGFRSMIAGVTRQNVHVDAASFLRNTKILESPLHGRGIFAARDIRAGELVFCEKAALMPNQYEPARASAALYAMMVRQLYDNPSLAKTILPLYGGDYPRTGLEGTIVDGVPVVDVFLLESIRLRNCFSSPLSTFENTKPGSHDDGKMAKGVWVHASHMNHNCVPNTMRSFVGDMFISRAVRDISAGEEMFQQYVPIRSDLAARQAQFKTNWGFECACPLCSGEAKSDMAKHKRRQQILAKVEKLGNKHKEPAKFVPESAIRTVDRLARQLEELHEEDIYRDLPRLTLIYPTMWLLEAHRGRKNHIKVVAYAKKVLRNFGFMVERVDSIEDIFHGSASPNSLMTIHMVSALKNASESYRVLGEMELADKFDEAAKFGYMFVTGFENDLSAINIP
ncbi:uncharacterized protein E0L32_000377 [Thyridium curvatum]|uniref:SET domain-containing protein n=1 Tax=Thyridium curvatum TaxID=1093900 RepID=A0A507B8N0_9PEZI|nr:uncharacterized protein E0L32_000377 [Thyridium curvatum]TPX16043.1 hypothetical protein E0L32_000377 [Thyridium curvatum]